MPSLLQRDIRHTHTARISKPMIWGNWQAQLHIPMFYNPYILIIYVYVVHSTLAFDEIKKGVSRKSYQPE